MRICTKKCSPSAVLTELTALDTKQIKAYIKEKRKKTHMKTIKQTLLKCSKCNFTC
jgi:hypothetical protein